MSPRGQHRASRRAVCECSGDVGGRVELRRPEGGAGGDRRGIRPGDDGGRLARWPARPSRPGRTRVGAVGARASRQHHRNEHRQHRCPRRVRHSHEKLHPANCITCSPPPCLLAARRGPLRHATRPFERNCNRPESLHGQTPPRNSRLKACSMPRRSDRFALRPWQQWKRNERRALCKIRLNVPLNESLTRSEQS
jgi:hypothetical protein